MFNRNNLPFGSRPDGSRPLPREGYGTPGGQPPYQRRDDYDGGHDPMGGAGYGAPPRRNDYDTTITDANHASKSYRSPVPTQGDMHGNRQTPTRHSGGRPAGGGDGRVWSLRPEKSPANSYTFGNLVAVCTRDFPQAQPGSDILLLINNLYVFCARPLDNFPQGCISFSDPQRTWAGVALTDSVKVQMYDPFSQGGQAYLGSSDIEVGFAGKKRTDIPYDQDELSNVVIKNFENHIFAPGQKILMDHKSIPLLLTVKTVQLMDLAEKPGSSASNVETSPTTRGILTRHTIITFFRDGKTGINLKSSSRRPAANSIIQPDFKFEDMGIGGLDSEFTTIFRRAFASRIFPPVLIEKLGIQHVKGILLYGPPGTGKTLMARQIGKFLNAREPKVVSGPEILNKFVGQSEQNVRDLFADAEKEYKEKGDESGLHIIIFDEIDAICKQRGSGAGGGTGVGDSVVNQLLSKLDGVDVLNNVLVIGMTNRKDMIDEALMRPGRLEVHVEISLPDETGRVQILKIHTQKMRENSVMDSDVNLDELAHLTKNYSGAELGGLVKAASSFAFNRHVKVGTMAGIRDDVVDMKVNRGDFYHALEEVKPAFGIAEEELESCVQGGIIDFSPVIKEILKEGQLFVKQVGEADATPLFSVLLHGHPASGKTALAARIAIDSGFPFIRLISPEDMVGFSEMAKVQYIAKAFMDAHKSRTSIVVVDNIERIIDWVPIGPRFSNTVLQTLMVSLRKQPPKGRRLLILATTTERAVLKQLDFYNSFDSDIMVPTVNTYDELLYILQQSEAFSPQEINEALGSIGDIHDNRRIGVGIKKILLSIETAKQDPDKVGRFARAINRAIDEDLPAAEPAKQDPEKVGRLTRKLPAIESAKQDPNIVGHFTRALPAAESASTNQDLYWRG